MFSDAWARISRNSNGAVYGGTYLWTLLWFCHTNIEDWSTFNWMTEDMNISSESYFMALSALICCFTTPCIGCSSWPLPFLNEGASKMASTWAWCINHRLSYHSWRQPMASSLTSSCSWKSLNYMYSRTILHCILKVHQLLKMLQGVFVVHCHLKQFPKGGPV